MRQEQPEQRASSIVAFCRFLRTQGFHAGMRQMITALDAARIIGADMQGFRPATETYALLLARRMRERHGAIWGLGETGATGPTGNRYGDPAGHTCIGVVGPIERAVTLRTGSSTANACHTLS